MRMAKMFEDAKLKAIQELINTTYKVYYGNTPDGKQMPPEVAWPPEEIEQQLEYMDRDGYSLVQHDNIFDGTTMLILFDKNGDIRAKRMIKTTITLLESEDKT